MTDQSELTVVDQPLGEVVEKPTNVQVSHRLADVGDALQLAIATIDGGGDQLDLAELRKTLVDAGADISWAGVHVARHPFVEREDLRALLGEGFHVAFRKACDSPLATKIWNLIADMDDRDYAGVIDFVAWGTAYSLGLPQTRADEQEGLSLDQFRAVLAARIKGGVELAVERGDHAAAQELQSMIDEMPSNEEFLTDPDERQGLVVMSTLLGIPVALPPVVAVTSEG